MRIELGPIIGLAHDRFKFVVEQTLLSILDHPFDILAISETKIIEDSEPISNVFIEGYDFVHTPTKTKNGGVGLFIKKGLNFKIREDLNKSVFNIYEFQKCFGGMLISPPYTH